MKVKIKKLRPDAVIPKYSTEGSAGMDLTAIRKWIDNHGNLCYGIGLAFEIPEGYVGLIFPRSSLAKYEMNLANSVGVIDSDYRGEVTVKLRPSLSFYTCYGWDKNGATHMRAPYCPFKKDYNIGDRVAQMIIIPYPKIEWEEVEELPETERSNGGYGSTGK